MGGRGGGWEGRRGGEAYNFDGTLLPAAAVQQGLEARIEHGVLACVGVGMRYVSFARACCRLMKSSASSLQGGIVVEAVVVTVAVERARLCYIRTPVDTSAGPGAAATWRCWVGMDGVNRGTAQRRLSKWSGPASAWMTG